MFSFLIFFFFLKKKGKRFSTVGVGASLLAPSRSWPRPILRFGTPFQFLFFLKKKNFFEFRVSVESSRNELEPFLSLQKKKENFWATRYSSANRETEGVG